MHRPGSTDKSKSRELDELAAKWTSVNEQLSQYVLWSPGSGDIFAQSGGDMLCQGNPATVGVLKPCVSFGEEVRSKKSKEPCLFVSCLQLTPRVCTIRKASPWRLPVREIKGSTRAHRTGDPPVFLRLTSCNKGRYHPPGATLAALSNCRLFVPPCNVLFCLLLKWAGAPLDWS
jgi:hypothetical protein